MLRHDCGFKLANDGLDTRALQHFLGHKNINHTVRYTEMAPDRFKGFWRDWRPQPTVSMSRRKPVAAVRAAVTSPNHQVRKFSVRAKNAPQRCRVIR
jgi:hypothetical protein